MSSAVPAFSNTERRVYCITFYAAAVYNLIWGVLVILFPLAPFRWAGMPPPNYPELWQCIGMFVMVYAIGYYCLARDPLRYAPFALIGLLGKLFGPIGMLWAHFTTNHVPWIAVWVNVTNDLIWLPVFVPFVWKTLISKPQAADPLQRV